MKRFLNECKPFDLVIIAFCILLSFVPTAAFLATKSTTDTGTKIAVIRIDGKEVERFYLDKVKNKTVTYHPNKNQYNIIEIDNGRIRDKEDNSPDQVAVKQGWISEVGQIAICLPHKLVIEIIGDSSGEDNYLIY